MCFFSVGKHWGGLKKKKKYSQRKRNSWLETRNKQVFSAICIFFRWVIPRITDYLNKLSNPKNCWRALLLTGRYSELQGEFSAAVRTSSEQKELILKLEHDLSTIQAMSSLPRPEADGSEISNMGNIPEPIKEASASFAGKILDLWSLSRF